MSSPLLLLLLSTVITVTAAAATSAYPSVTTDCTVSPADNELVPVRREVYGGGRIFDISHRYTVDMPLFWSPNGLGHMIDRYFDAGFDVDTLDLEVLNGPALLVDVPRDSNITAQVMESLKIPKGVRRVLFRTLNTDRRLMYKSEYDTSYVGFTTDGARWLVKNTDIKLVGLDFLSVASDDHLLSAHLEFFESREIILVEGLKLEDVPVGMYNVHCLPLRLVGAEGSPIRCILIK
ncbi:hypothetical protein V6N13_050166 [Hibiscus sabdariffa]